MNLYRVALAVIVVNAAGIALRYFDLNTYFIFLGFRFHLGSLLTFLILFNRESLNNFYGSFIHPPFRRKFLPVLWILFSLLILIAVLFLFGGIKTGDPDFFYEFGLSSVFDYPLYLIWNFPQFCLLFYTLLIFSGMTRFPHINVTAGLLLIFGYETIPFSSSFAYSDMISLILLSLTASFFVVRLQNIYWFAIVIFSTVWSIILLFGSKSPLIINIFFARQYDTWEGFIYTAKEFSHFIIPLFFLVLLIVITVYSAYFGRKLQKKDL